MSRVLCALTVMSCVRAGELLPSLLGGGEGGQAAPVRGGGPAGGPPVHLQQSPAGLQRQVVNRTHNTQFVDIVF